MSNDLKKKTALLTAYDVDPYRGGESAVGWNVVRQASTSIKVILITRVNNCTNIDRYIATNGGIENLTVKYFDLPYLFRFWKKGPRGATIYFYLWQMFMPLHIKLNKYSFDLLHSVNFVADSFPHFLWWFKKPVIWGPISHHEKIPKQYIKKYGCMVYLKDRLVWLVKLFFWRLDPFHHLAKWKSSKILSGNSSVFIRLKGNSLKYIPFSSSAVSSVPESFPKSENQTFSFLVVARLVPLKSVDLAIEAFEDFFKKNSTANVELNIVGSGPFEKKLKALARNKTCAELVKFHGHIKWDLLQAQYQSAAVSICTSHEGGGMSVVESLSYGLPTICFDNYGPGETVDSSCGILIHDEGYSNSVTQFSKAMATLFNNPHLRKTLSQGAKTRVENHFLWTCRGEKLQEVYSNVLNGFDKQFRKS